MFEQEADQGDEFGVADAIGNLEQQIGLTAAPIGENELALEQLGPRIIETIRQFGNGRFQKLAQIIGIFENLRKRAIGEIADWIVGHRGGSEVGD